MKTLIWQCWLCGVWQRDISANMVTLDLEPVGRWPAGSEDEELTVWLCDQCAAKVKPPQWR